MPTPVIHSAEFNEGYQIDSAPDGLEISTTSYHARPLRLNREQLARFGLRFEQDHYIPLSKPSDEAQEEPKGVVDQRLASLHNVIGLVTHQRGKKKWKWDLANLHRAQIILGGLDEAMVQKILSEEES
jgi:hypothetical protein